MLRVGINGVGRIGKAIFRTNINKKKFKIVAFNDINPDIKNVAYQINYATMYDALKDKFLVEGHYIVNSQDKIRVFCERHIDDVDWESERVDLVIDATGVLDNVFRAKNAIRKHNLTKVVFTTTVPVRVSRSKLIR